MKALVEVGYKVTDNGAEGIEHKTYSKLEMRKGNDHLPDLVIRFCKRLVRDPAPETMISRIQQTGQYKPTNKGVQGKHERIHTGTRIGK